MDLFIDFVNNFLWKYVLLYGLLAVGIYFTVRLRFQQFVHFGEMFRLLAKGAAQEGCGITPFQALCTSLASRVGTGSTSVFRSP